MAKKETLQGQSVEELPTLRAIAVEKAKNDLGATVDKVQAQKRSFDSEKGNASESSKQNKASTKPSEAAEALAMFKGKR